jgi:hypothetical protein
MAQYAGKCKGAAIFARTFRKRKGPEGPLQISAAQARCGRKCEAGDTRLFSIRQIRRHARRI